MNIDLFQRIESAFHIKVAVIPIGHVPESKFNTYFEELRSQLSVISAENFADSLSSKGERSPFKQYSYQHAKMRFQFIRGDDVANQNRQSTYNAFSANTPSSEWNDFHVHKRVMAVIGICHCPSSPDLDTAHQDFLAAKAKYSGRRKRPLPASGGSTNSELVDSSASLAGFSPSGVSSSSSSSSPSSVLADWDSGGALQFRCFAFEPLEEQLDVVREDYVMFPNQDVDHLRFYLATVFHDLACSLLEAFQTQISIIAASTALLRTPLDPPDARSSEFSSDGGHDSRIGQDVNRDKDRDKDADGDRGSGNTARRRRGRIEKYVGQYCLLAGATEDALEHFQLAIAHSSDASDWLWLAGSYEDQAAAYVAQHLRDVQSDGPVAVSVAVTDSESGSSSSSASSKGPVVSAGEALVSSLSSPSNLAAGDMSVALTAPFLDAVPAVYDNVLACYQKTPFSAFLTIEAGFKLARYLVHYEKNIEASQLLSSIYQLAADCSAQDQIALTVEIALLCDRMKMVRKFGFYLLQAAILYRELRQHVSQLTLLNIVAPAFRLFGVVPDARHVVALSEPASPSPSPSSSLSSRSKAACRDLSVAGRDTVHVGKSCADIGVLLSRERQMERGIHTDPWVHLKLHLIEQMAYAARSLQDVKTVATCVVYLLRALYPWLQVEFQKSLVAELWSVTGQLSLDTGMDLCGLPCVSGVLPLALPRVLEPVAGAVPKPKMKNRGSGDVEGDDDDDDDADVFFFRPNDDTKVKAARSLVWTSGDCVKVRVFLTNPLAVELIIQSISLSVKPVSPTNPTTFGDKGADEGSLGVVFEAYAQALVLPPLARNHCVVLMGKPLGKAGTLCIRGVNIRTFNFTCEHRVDGEGRCILPYCPPVPIAMPSMPSEGPVLVHSIKVVESLPCLEVSSSSIGADAGLFEDECMTFDLTFRNAGTLPIGALHFSFTETYALNSLRSQATYYEKDIAEVRGDTSDDTRLNVVDDVDVRDGRGGLDSAPAVCMPRDFEQEAGIVCNDEILQDVLPLLPEESVTVRVSVTGDLSVCGATFTVRYSETQACRSHRSLAHRVSWRTTPALSVARFQVLPSYCRHSEERMRLLSSSLMPDNALRSSLTLVFDIDNAADVDFSLSCRDEVLLRSRMMSGDADADDVLVTARDIENWSVSGEGNSTQTIAAMSSQRLIFVIDQFSFGRDRDAVLQYLGYLSSTVPAPSTFSGSVHAWCREYVLRRLHLVWQCSPDRHRLGTLSLRRQHLLPALSPRALCAFVPSSFLFSAHMDVEGGDVVLDAKRPGAVWWGAVLAGSRKDGCCGCGCGCDGGSADKDLARNVVSAQCHREAVFTGSELVRARVGVWTTLQVVIRNQSGFSGPLDVIIRPYRESAAGCPADSGGSLPVSLSVSVPGPRRVDMSSGNGDVIWHGTLCVTFSHVDVSTDVKHSLPVCFMGTGCFSFQIMVRVRQKCLTTVGCNDDGGVSCDGCHDPALNGGPKPTCSVEHMCVAPFFVVVCD